MALAFLGVMGLAGCHDWPDERVTAIEAQNILRELSEIETAKEPNVSIPALYRQPPKKTRQVVGGEEEWKLFYFVKYHTAEQLAEIVREQFSSKIFDAKGEKSQVVPNFAVTANPGTNQLVVRAQTENDIDAILEVIEEIDVAPIQVRIECMVSELYADLTVDRETTLLIENLFGEGVALGGKVDSAGNLLPAFPGAALRDPAREKFGLKIGVSRGDPGHRFEALVDLLVSRGYLKVLMNPTLEVVNGQMAKIQAKEHVPLQEVTIQAGGFGGETILRTQTEYYDIIDSLQITPHVYADGCIGLETSAQIAEYLTPEGIKQLPIVTERTVTNKENRIRHGESLIIGGIRKTEKRDVVRGVPILKDIPVLNLLFSGRDFEERAKDVIFIITPTISTGGIPNQEMVNTLRERHQSPMTQALHEQVMDPLGLKARQDEQQRQIEQARQARQESEAARAAARMEALETSQQVETLEAELEQTKAQMTQLSTKAEQAQAETEQAQAETEQAQAATQQARTEAEKAKAEAEKTKVQKPPEENAQPQPDAPGQNKNKADAPKEEEKGPGQPAPTP